MISWTITWAVQPSGSYSSILDPLGGVKFRSISREFNASAIFGYPSQVITVERSLLLGLSLSPTPHEILPVSVFSKKGFHKLLSTPEHSVDRACKPGQNDNNELLYGNDNDDDYNDDDSDSDSDNDDNDDASDDDNETKLISCCA